MKNVAKSPFPAHVAPFFGSNGVTVSNGPGYKFGPFYSIVILQDATFTEVDIPDNDGDSLNTVSLVAGQSIDVGTGIKGFNIASGLVIGYKM